LDLKVPHEVQQMGAESEIVGRLEKIESALKAVALRQEALIAAINKQTSVVDTTNELISRLIAWPDEVVGRDSPSSG
jgi:hypothetical protein